MAFDPDRLVERLPPAAGYWVAFSGGLDSTVLLHALAAGAPRLAGPLRAVHVDHGWSLQSPAWARHCQAVCDGLGVACVQRRVDAPPAPGESPEAAARKARYGVLRGLVGGGEAVVTAHHRDDQAETVLLQLLRGAGPRGLAAMAPEAVFGAGRLLRPLLGVPRAELRAYAAAAGLRWLDDPANADPDYDRSYLRQSVAPRLRRRWPGFEAVLARSADHCAEASALLDERAREDRAAARGRAPGSLAVSRLRGLSGPRRRNLLRFWLRTRGLPVPGTARLRELERLLAARADAEPRLAWPGAEVRRYRDDLHALVPLAPVPTGAWPWDLAGPFELPGLGRLVAGPAVGTGLSAAACRGGVEVRFRAGGERCRPAPGSPSRPLKKLFQEAGVAPWWRARWPLLFVAGRLAAVPGLWTCQGWRAGPGEPGIAVALETLSDGAGPAAG